MAQLDMPQMPCLQEAMRAGAISLQEAWTIEAHETRGTMLGQPMTLMPDSLNEAMHRLHLFQMSASGPM